MRVFLTLSLILIPFFVSAQNPATEIRAVWLTTNWRLDWPRPELKSTEEQKEGLIKILDELKQNNFNTVFFQARSQGSAFYNSKIEPKSAYLNPDEFDPLQFAIEECHKRGIEIHAWLVTFPMGGLQNRQLGGKKEWTKKRPNYYKLYNDEWYLDPGHPEARNHILAIVNEVVNNYDIDGIHFDYIRYPSRDFPDAATFKVFGNGGDIFDWRRSNINLLVRQIYDMTKSMKKWVQVSSSPLGRYKGIQGIKGSNGWTAYNSVYQDAIEWLKEGKHDMLFPMLYYKDEYFYPFLDYWLENSYGRLVIPGLGAYQLAEEGSKWTTNSIIDQVIYSRARHVPGQAYFRAGNILDNNKGIKDALKVYYQYPAKLPPLKWLKDTKPMPPQNLEIYKDENGLLNIKWDNKSKDKYTYTIYSSTEDEIDINNPKHILEVGIHGDGYSFDPIVGDFGYYYSVTATDRYHNESESCPSAFFSHSDIEK